MLRTIRLVAWVLVAVAAAVAGWLVVDRWLGVDLGRTASTLLQPVQIGGPFTLTATDGRRVTEKDLVGHPSALFFGFTHCPDVCPTTLQEAGSWLQALGPEAEKLKVYFVSVDPERDTPEQMKLYLSPFDPRITGLTGTPDEVQAMLRAYKVYARKVKLDEGGYTMDHTAAVYLLDRNGQLAKTVSYKDPQDQAVAKLKALLAGT